MMRIAIWADQEGTSGVDSPRQMQMPGLPRTKATECQTQDVNAAIRGLRMNASPEIEVFDGHGSGGNMDPSRLEPGVKLVGGEPERLDMARAGRLRSYYDGWILLGQHAMEGTRDGFASHTNTGDTAIRMNGRFIGEIAEVAWFVGYYDIPTMLVVGDDAAAREAQAFYPGIRCVTVKKAQGMAGADLMPVDEARSLIQKAAAEALANLSQAKAYKLAGPIELDAMFVTPEQATVASRMPGCRRTDELTISYTAETYPEAVFAIHTVNALAGELWMNSLFQRIYEVEGAPEAIEAWYRELIETFVTGSKPFPAITY